MMPPPRRARGQIRGVLVLALVAPACAAGTERLVRRAVPATIDETIAAFEDPDIQRRLKKLIDLPDVQAAARRLAQGLTEGALDGLTEEERARKLRALSEDYVDTLTRALGKGLREEIEPAAAHAARAVVEEALAPVLAPQTRQGAAALVDAVTRRAVYALSQGVRDEAGPALASALQKDLGPAAQRVLEDNLGPALHKVIRDDLGPALREALSDEMVPTAGRFSREISREAVLGIVDAIEQLDRDERLAAVNERFWTRLNRSLNQGLRLGEIIAWILALVILILGIWLARTIIVRRHLEAERERSERMLIGILHELQRGGEVRVAHVLDKVQQRDPELARSRYFGEVVQRALAVTRDLFDGKPDLDGKPDDPPPRK